MTNQITEVELPDGSIAEFPANMTSEQITAVLQKQFPQQQAQTQTQTQPAEQSPSHGIDQFLGEVGTGAQQMATALPRAGLNVAGLVSMLAGKGAQAVGLDKLGGAAQGYAKDLFGYSKQLEEPLTGVKIPEWQKNVLDRTMESIPLTGAATTAVGALKGWGNPAKKLLLKELGYSGPAVGAATGAMGAAVSTPIGDYAINKIDNSTLSPQAKEVLKVAAPLFADMAVGITFENFLDNVFKNPVLSRTVDDLARSALVNPDGTVKMDTVQQILVKTLGEEAKPPAPTPKPKPTAVDGDGLRSKIEHSQPPPDPSTVIHPLEGTAKPPLTRETVEQELGKLEWFKKLSPEEQVDEVKEQLNFIATNERPSKFTKRSVTPDVVEATDLNNRLRVRRFDFTDKNGKPSPAFRMGSYVATKIGAEKNQWRILQWDNGKWRPLDGSFRYDTQAVEVLQKLREAGELGGPVDDKRLVSGLSKIFKATEKRDVELADQVFGIKSKSNVDNINNRLKYLSRIIGHQKNF